MKKLIVATVTLVTIISLSFAGSTTPSKEKCEEGKCQTGKCAVGKCCGGKGVSGKANKCGDGK